MQTFELGGERVVLRDFTEDDAPEVLAYHLDPEVMRFLPTVITTNRTLGAIERLLREASDASRQIPRLKYDLAVTIDCTVIGAARLHLSQTDDRRAEIGYILQRSRWGAGIATEVAQLLIAYGFTGLGLNKIWASVHEANAGSLSVLRKAGMRLVGPLEMSRQFAEDRGPSLVYVIEREDWE